MVPGSTFRYGSSFCRETVRWRAFRMFPIDAAVMPLPSEETTPPVTKTYFDIDDPPGGFSDFTGARGRLNLYFSLWFQDDHLCLVLRDGRFLHRQLGLGLRRGHSHLLQEPVDRVELQLQARYGVVHRHHISRLQLPDHLRGLSRVHRGPTSDGHQQDVRRCDSLGFGVVQLEPQVAEVADPDVVDLDQVDGVAPMLGAFLRVVIRRHADHAEAGYLVLAWTSDLVGSVANDLRVVVVVVLMADRHDLRVHPRKLQADRGRIRVGDHCRATAAKPEAAMSQPGDVQLLSPRVLTCVPER